MTTSECATCGFTWITGQHGGHNCTAILKDLLEEEEAIRERMARLLAETAIALKGPEKPLHKHDWSNLPKIAAELRLACDIGEVLLEEARAATRAEALLKEVEKMKESALTGTWEPYFRAGMLFTCEKLEESLSPQLSPEKKP